MTPREALNSMFPKTGKNPLGQVPALPHLLGGIAHERAIAERAWYAGMEAVAVAACELVERSVEEAKQIRQNDLDAKDQQRMKDGITIAGLERVLDLMEKAAAEAVASARVQVKELREDKNRAHVTISGHEQLLCEVYDVLSTLPPERRDGEVATLIEKLKGYAVPF